MGKVVAPALAPEDDYGNLYLMVRPDGVKVPLTCKASQLQEWLDKGYVLATDES